MAYLKARVRAYSRPSAFFSSLLSADVRQWAAREHDRVRTWRREAPWFALGMSVGIAAVPLALAVAR